MKKFDLAIVVLAALTNDIVDLKPLMPGANRAFNKIGSGDIFYIKAPRL